MRPSRRQFLSATGVAPWMAAAAPEAALPSARQLRWHQLEFYGFLHFTINTFTDKEWGYGDEDPALFNPTAFDAGAIAKTLKDAGMRAVILTCKHHDGFCLWPTRTTEHSIRRSPWRGGKGDVVREISDAARAQGLQFGVYLSPWDRNSAAYGRPEYISIYREQLRELLTGYGEIFEVWHDGANGGDGYYGGARERRRIDKHTYYDWPGTWKMIRDLQPNAVIFSDVGPDVRWVGNERGVAAETSWATYDPVGENGGPAAPGDVRASESQTGTARGKQWLPAECDVSIRPGWFWHEKENARVKTAAELADLYFKSVGRGGSFLLNVPPDRRGLIHENDAASLRTFGEHLRRTFGKNLAGGARLNPDHVLTLAAPVSFNVVRIREDITQGHRVEEFAVDAWEPGQWREIASATSIGACRLLRLPQSVTAARVRLRVSKSAAAPAIAEFALFDEPALAEKPIRVRVVTGGHSHETSFYSIFDGRGDLSVTVEPHPNAYAGDLRRSVDVLVLYDMISTLDEKQKKNLRDFAESGKGIVALHHSVCSFQQGWDWYGRELLGGNYRPESTYLHDVQMKVTAPAPHAITSGVAPLDINDETYKRMWISPDVKVLLRTDHASADGPVAWISPYEKSRVVYIQLGHGRAAHEHAGYRRLVWQAVRWAAGRRV